MATSECESRECSSTDSDSSTESEKEVKHVALRVCVFINNKMLGNRSSLFL